MNNILIVVDGYTPAETYGGPTVSIDNLVKLLHENFSISVVCRDHEISSKTSLNSIISNEINYGKYNEKILYLDDKHFNYNYIISKIDKPDMVYVNSLFSVKLLMIAYKVAKNNNTKVLVAPRGQLEDNALKIKGSKKLPFISFLNWMPKSVKNRIRYHATNEEEKQSIQKRIKNSDQNIYVLNNIPSIPDRLEPISSKQPNKINMCFISRIQTKKNLDFAIKVLGNVSDRIYVNYDIYGPIENEIYWKECQKMISKLPEHVNVTYRGMISHDNIFDTFAKYDLFFFPTKSENYGHVIAESLFSGCPVLISDQTPWNDVAEYEAGEAFSLSQIENFYDFINDIALMSAEELIEVKKNAVYYARKKTEVDKLKNLYINIFSSLGRASE